MNDALAEARNAHVADLLRQAAALLEGQGANPFRISAYRNAAETIAHLERDVGELLEESGTRGLEELPGVGRGIASAIAEIVTSGRWTQLERLRGEADPARLFQSVPGIGEELARRIHETLRVDTLEALEIAAHDGRLEDVPGVGARRAAAIRASLDSLLKRVRPRPPHPGAQRNEPEVDQLLQVDLDYRQRAEAGELPKIAPRRFNPAGEAWLPILHTNRQGWHFTVLYSNTARAHELERTRDWVVVYFYDDDHAEGQRTIVTETRGALTGLRVVRGREEECKAHYAGGATAEV